MGAVVSLVVVFTFAFFWTSARDEVFYLCGNFVKGVTRDSVVRQLDTGEFLRYEQTNVGQGSRILVNSSLTLDVYTCTITLDQDDDVINAVFD